VVKKRPRQPIELSKMKKLKLKLPNSEKLEKYKGSKTDKDFKKTISNLQGVFQNDGDFVVYELDIFGNYPAAILYLNSIVDKEIINHDISKALQKLPQAVKEKPKQEELKNVILQEALYFTEIEEENDLSKIIEALLQGKTIILISGLKQALLLETKKVDKRSITEPEAEQVIRGPREGMIESLQTNIALLRSRLPTPELRIQYNQVGEVTKSKIAVGYIEGIANKELITEVKRRLEQIKIDRVLDSGYIEQFIEDNPRSPFPQVQNSERPDVIAGNLLEGRVVILVDGSPSGLIVPATFVNFYQTSEDYNMRFIMATLIRWVRIAALLFSLLMPSLYVALISFHPELIPTAFAVAVASGRAGVPFPTVVEVLLMESAMEILREATVRMPKQVGSALSIVGVLVVGEAAVSAGFVSPITVVVIALTSIGSFATPAYNMAIGFRMVRFPLLFLTGLLGFYGFILGVLLVNNHLISLKSFGVPYMSPLSPMNFEGLKDTLVRAPLHALKDRPENLLPIKKKRVQNDKLEKNNPLQPTKNKEEGEKNK
jgi:spore germination protein KA